MNYADLAEHPAAAAFPLVSDAELAELAADIKANGLREPLCVWDAGGKWVLLDGRNRLRACLAAGVAPHHRVVDTKDPIGFVVSANLRRRHLSPSQLAVLADELAQLRHGTNQHKKQDAPIGASSLTQDQAADLVGASRRNTQRAREVREKGAPELLEAVKRGEVSLNAASQAVKLMPPEKQRAAVAEKRVAEEVVVAAKAAAPPVEWDDEVEIEALRRVRKLVNAEIDAWGGSLALLASALDQLADICMSMEEERVRNRNS
jgi:ParB-like chromosome segregation protein Spo0J